MVLTYVFILYIHLVFTVTGFGSIWDIGEYNSLIRLDEINLIPFNSQGVLDYILNIIMFIPLGFLIPFIWRDYRNYKKIVFIGFILSLTIETSQLFNRRMTDINDLIMNTLGSIIGYILFKNYKKKVNRIDNNIILHRYEPLIYLGLSILGRFFLYNWKLLI